MEKKHYETREQPNGDQFHVQPKSDYTIGSRSHQGTHAKHPGFKLCRSILIYARFIVVYTVPSSSLQVHIITTLVKFNIILYTTYLKSNIG